MCAAKESGKSVFPYLPKVRTKKVRAGQRAVWSTTPPSYHALAGRSRGLYQESISFPHAVPGPREKRKRKLKTRAARRDQMPCLALLSLSKLGNRGCRLPPSMNGSAFQRSSSRNQARALVASGSNSTPPFTFRTRTRSPSNQNSRGSRTAWLRPTRNSLAIATSVIKDLWL